MTTDIVAVNRKLAYRRLNKRIFSFQMHKPMVDVWIEGNVNLAEGTTVYPGPYEFKYTPYMREIVNLLHPTNPTRFASIMKDGQSGFTTALVIGGILYIIEVTPDGILFTASDINLAQKTIEERFDPVVRSSKKEHLIRSNVVKKTNNKTGDTAKKKEFAGGVMTSAGTNSANTFRMFSAKYIFADDYDTAPKEVGKEGSPKMVMKTRQNSFGDKAKTFFISTPTVTQTSNIYEQYLLGTQKKWNWECPACTEYFAVEWVYERDGMRYGGIVWELDENHKLKLESVRYKCPHCGHLIEEKDKYELNLKGKWVSTCHIPAERLHESYQKNSIYNPPGFDGWRVLVEEWLKANPYGEKADQLLLKTFNNLRLGLPFADMGDAPRSNSLMQNTRAYKPGTFPDVTAEKDGNGQIIMLTLACDINGIMNEDIEDVRLDWSVVAHCAGGQTYEVDHGSIGTFKRIRHRTKQEIEEDKDRVKWTLTPNVKNSVWPEFEKIMLKEWHSENKNPDSEPQMILITVVDTGFFTSYASGFVDKMQAEGYYIYGVKGKQELDYRRNNKDSICVSRSKEKPSSLYIVEVDQLKDELSENMKLRIGEDGSQPAGFMNFPQPNDGKYEYNTYFCHYEGEVRQEVPGKNGTPAGFRWKKKNNDVLNHFWDVRVYNMAAPYVYFDLVKRYDPKYAKWTYDDFISALA